MKCVLRGESVETTGLQLQQPVFPVGFGDTEIMDGASQDAKGLSLQSGRSWQPVSNMGLLFLYRHPPERQNVCVWLKKWYK